MAVKIIMLIVFFAIMIGGIIAVIAAVLSGHGGFIIVPLVSLITPKLNNEEVDKCLNAMNTKCLFQQKKHFVNQKKIKKEKREKLCQLQIFLKKMHVFSQTR